MWLCHRHRLADLENACLNLAFVDDVYDYSPYKHQEKALT
jgi:hypothetical protein